MPPEACNIPLTETILSASTVRIALPVPYTAATQHSGWKQATGPYSLAYTKENPKHICFKLQTSGGTVALDSTEHCESRYTAGRRSYSLSDPAFGGGSLSITTWALPDKEGAIWQFNARNFKEFHPVLLASISEIRNSKLNRNGDMGADPADSFEAPLQPQQLQSFPVQIDGTLYSYWKTRNYAH